MRRFHFYQSALKNLGLISVVRRSFAKNFASGDMKLTSKYLKYPVHARNGTTDLAVFDQIFVEREYQCLDFVKDVETIIDLGANCGFSSAYLLSRFPEAKLLAVEPDEGNFASLTRNLAPFGNRVQALKGAVWSDCREIFFEENSTSQGNEWGRRTSEKANNSICAIPAWDIPTLMEKAGFSSLDLLKIDVEGAERAIFQADDLSWLNGVRSMVIELHGPECEYAFHAAITNQKFSISRCGELTVCLR